RFHIDRHRHKRVDQRDGVGARFLRDVRHLSDAGDVWGKLHDQRTLCEALRAPHEFIERSRIAAKLDAPVLRVRTGNVQLEGSNAFAVIQDFKRVLVIFARVPKDVGDHDGVLESAQLGKFFFNERPGTDVLQANRVQHSRGGFVQTRRRIANHRFARQPFYDEPAQAFQMHDVFELDTVAEGATGRNYWVLEFDTRNGDVKIGGHLSS